MYIHSHLNHFRTDPDPALPRTLALVQIQKKYELFDCVSVPHTLRTDVNLMLDSKINRTLYTVYAHVPPTKMYYRIQWLNDNVQWILYIALFSFWFRFFIYRFWQWSRRIFFRVLVFIVARSWRIHTLTHLGIQTILQWTC